MLEFSATQSTTSVMLSVLRNLWVAIQLTKSVPEFMPQFMPGFMPEFVPQIHFRAHPDTIGQKIHAIVCARDFPYPYLSEVG